MALLMDTLFKLEDLYEMLNEKLDGVFVYDAQLIYDSLSAKYIK